MAKPLNLFGGDTAGAAFVAERRALLKTWAGDPWAFLTGRDVDGTPMILTQDEREDDGRPFKAFPSDKPYLRELAAELLGPQQITLIDKSRQMMVSTLCMLLLYWTILFKRGRKCLVSKQNEKQAEVLMEDKIRSVHRRAPDWFQFALPISMTPKLEITAAHTGSTIYGVTQNAASTWFKGNTASIAVIDEAAEQEYFGPMLESAQPMARRIWVPTTALQGNPGAETFKRLAHAA